MRSPPKGGGGGLKAKGFLLFLMHQLIGTIGVGVGALLLTGLAFDLLRLLGRHYTMGYSHWILTGTPYFPVQIVLALFLGWLLSRRFHHRSMLWVWILPTGILCCAFAVLPTVTSLTLQFRLSHFFGWGCRPENRCFDQIGVTLPFYIAVAYSAGALLARRTSSPLTGDNPPRGSPRLTVT